MVVADCIQNGISLEQYGYLEKTSSTKLSSGNCLTLVFKSGIMMSDSEFKKLLKQTAEALPPNGKAEMNATIKFSLLPKVIEDFLSLYPTSVLSTQLPITREAQRVYTTHGSFKLGAYTVPKEESRRLSLVSCRESARYAYRIIFEEKSNLTNLTDEQKSLLADILVMIELLQDGDCIQYDPTKCRVCQNEAKSTCGGCKSMKYCSTFCQKAGYGMHKKQCK